MSDTMMRLLRGLVVLAWGSTTTALDRRSRAARGLRDLHRNVTTLGGGTTTLRARTVP